MNKNNNIVTCHLPPSLSFYWDLPLVPYKKQYFLPYLDIFYLLGGANLNLLIPDYDCRTIQLGSSSRQLKLTDFLLETSP